jgi:hypothetical protein
MTGLHGFPNRSGKKQLSKIGVKTKVASDCFFTENEPNQAGRSNPPLVMTELRQPLLRQKAGSPSPKLEAKLRPKAGFVTMLKATGASNAIAQMIVGHDSAAVNAHYTHLSAGDTTESISKLPDVTK